MIINFLAQKALPVMSAVAAAMVATDLPPHDASALDWLMRGIVAVALAIIAFFLRRVAKTFDDLVVKVGRHDGQLKLHNLMYEFWLEDMKDKNLNVYTPGRRKTDYMVRAMVRAHEEWESLGSAPGQPED